jgi:hypothetical protein
MLSKLKIGNYSIKEKAAPLNQKNKKKKGEV